MCKKGEHNGCQHFNKLAQVETKPQITIEDDFNLGKNTLISDTDKLKKRAPRKYISRGLSLAFVNYIDSIELGTDLCSSDLKIYKKSFWNMFYCVSTLKKKNGRITGQYCKNRLCMVCNSIRQAQLINKYVPIMADWKEARFVTVTGGPTVSKDKLKARLDWMQSVDKGIRKKIQKRYSRGTGKKMVAIKKIECTFSLKTFGFHPHYHFIFKDADVADLYVKEWLVRTSLNGTYEGAQKNIPCDIKTIKELTKYFTKVSTSVETEAGNEPKNPKKLIYLDALFHQFIAFRGRRTFAHYGFKTDAAAATKIVDEDTEILEAVEGAEGGPATDYYTWVINDWYSLKTGLGASGYTLDNRTRNIVKSIRTNYSIYD